MKHRVAWILCLASMIQGLAIGILGTYWITQYQYPQPHPGGEGPESTALHNEKQPDEKQPDQPEIPAPIVPASPQLQRATLLVEDVLRAGGIISAQSFTLRGVSGVYYAVVENNSYENGSSYVDSRQGPLSDGDRMTVAIIPRFGTAGLVRLSVSFSRDTPGGGNSSGGNSQELVLPQKDHVKGETTSEWALAKPVDVEIGQEATLYQFGSVYDTATDGQDETPLDEIPLHLLRDPHGEFKPLPRIQVGQHPAVRLTIRILIVDGKTSKWENWMDRKEAKKFLDVKGFLKRAAAEQK